MAEAPALARASLTERLIPLAPAGFVLLWSTGFIGARLGLPHAPPLTFLAIRMALVSGLILLLLQIWRQPLPRGRLLLDCMVVGLLVHAGYLGGVFAAMSLGLPVGLAALIVGLQPALTAIWSHASGAEGLSPRRWLGIALGFAGVALAVTPGLLSAAGGGAVVTPAALLLEILALAAITVGTVWQRRVSGRVALLPATLVQYLAGVLVLGLLAWSVEGACCVAWTTEFLLALGWLSLILSLGAIFLLMGLIRRGSAVNTAALFYLVPPVTAVTAWALFGERLSWQALAGLALTAIGVQLVGRRSRPRTP